MNTMKWLLKREFWEHKGGFFWAPLIAAGIYILLSLMGILIGDHAASAADPHGFHVGMAQMIHDASDPAKSADVHRAVQFTFQALAFMPLVVTIFVVFFYCLGCLYNERSDKSILFWKSLPISDRATIASKLISAMLVAPVIGTAVAIATSLVLFVCASLTMLVLHGVNPAPLWDVSAILTACVAMIVAIPVTSLWALPTIGWLMLCSAWARRVPFLWATVVPFVAGIMVWMTGIMNAFHLSASWFWSNITWRLLGGLIPNMELLYRYAGNRSFPQIHDPTDLNAVFSIGNILQGLANPQLWIGVLAGAAMIVVATRLRRWRDEG